MSPVKAKVIGLGGAVVVVVVEKGGVVMLDGQKVGTALNVASYRMQ